MLASTIAIVGGFLIDGYGGPPLANAVVLIEGERIAAVGTVGEIEVPGGSTIVDAEGLTVMPGLIDTHVHLDILGHGDYPTWHGMARADYGEVMALSAAQLLRHGVTTARDAGGEIEASARTKKRIEAGEILGPRLVVSGGWIENWPDDQARAHHRRFNYNVHTADEARAVTASLIEKGADAIKAYTGLTVEQMRAITDEAHKRGKIVGAHVYTDEEIVTAIEGGADFLDHAGSGHQNPLYSDETLRLMALRQVPVGQSIAHRVTLYPAHLSWPERVDDPGLARELGRFAGPIRDSLRNFPGLSYFGRIHLEMRVAPEAAAQLFASGIKIIMGTDSGTPGFFHRDSVWREADALVRLAGMRPNEVILATTKHAAETLRVDAGVIAKGKLADVILVKGNPLDSVLYLQNVEKVIKGGVVQKF